MEDGKPSFDAVVDAIHALPDPLCILDRELRFVFLNQAFSQLTGLDPIAVQGHQAGAWLPSDRAPTLQVRNSEAFASGSPSACEETLRDPQGEWHTLIAQRVIYTDRAGKTYLLLSLHDVTASKRAEVEFQQTLQDLQRTQAQLVQNEKMSSLGQLVAGIAHEINNPVNFIYGNISHASEYTNDLLDLVALYQQHFPQVPSAIAAAIADIDLDFIREDLPKTILSMRIGAERIRGIVQSLRNFSRLDEAILKAVDIHEGLESTLIVLQHRLKGTPHRGEIQVARNYGHLPQVECFAGQLNQAFMNILVNALDALEERDATRSLQAGQKSPSQIRLRTERINADWVRIAIADNGPGIPQNIQAKIFDPFFTTKPVGRGTGLGLSIAYQIVVEKHGGFLFCVSQEDRGAEFIIEIPVRQN